MNRSQGAVFLAATVIAIPIARRLRLSAVLGYLAAGVAIGPWGLGLIGDVENILHFAEFGVVLMLFLVGLELDPKRLSAMRRPIFGWGSVQLLGSASLLMALGMLGGVSAPAAGVAALGLAMSSTAIGLGVLAESNLAATSEPEKIPVCGIPRDKLGKYVALLQQAGRTVYVE